MLFAIVALFKTNTKFRRIILDFSKIFSDCLASGIPDLFENWFEAGKKAICNILNEKDLRNKIDNFYKDRREEILKGDKL